ncbi:MAG TPA: amino acid adenylation domain-containing protein, partial [Thermoanaerobaculia bacterium]
PFINTLPLRVAIDDSTPFDTWLRGLQKEAGTLREFEFSRLVDIQRWSALPAGESLFETLLVFENYPVDASLSANGSGLEFGAVTFVERGHYGLALAAIPGERLALRLYYDGARFDRVTMQRALAQLRTLLDAAAADEVTSANRWSLLDADERAALVQSPPLHVDPRCAHHLFEAQADRTPDAIALAFDGERMTYRELDRRANQLAHALLRRGAGPEVLIGIRLDRSFELIVAVLGVWKAGAAYLPLDPSYPERRLAHMVSDSAAQLILTERDLAELANESGERPNVPVTPEQLAYVLYTSGSTGLPKGTLVEHRGVTNLAHALGEAFSIDAQSRVLQFASLSFDVSVSELVMALCFGATLQLARRDELLPGPAFAELLRDRGITHLSIVPSVLALVPPIELPELRCLIVGGERCPDALLQTWSKGRQLFNCYGPTEATVCTTYGLYDGGRLTIGKPIANARTYVLDRSGAPVPIGVAGELHIGGAGVARGYAARPELTAERFVRDPFSSEPNARMYKSGDLVRTLPDGTLEFLGRVDEQLKLRGYRIEPGEIAHVLRERGGLRDAAVVVRDGRLVAYGIADGETSTRELRDVCEEWLPEHMVPAAYVLVDAFPLTPTGKLDRDALPDPDLEQHVVREAFVAATSDVEAALANVWTKVLGVSRVGTADNFFELGGDSILSLQVVSNAAQAGLQITPRDVFEHPTVAALARVAKKKTVAAASAAELTPYPLTPIQRWFFEQPLSHRDHWNQAVLVEVSPEVSGEVLANAIAALARHHDAFRTRFADAQQHYADRGEIAFESVAMPADLAEHANRANASLDLARGPLARAVHFHGEGKSLLLVVLHHLIVDGVSWRILLEDLTRLCRGEQLEPAMPFGEWAQRLEAFARTNEVDVDYWLALDVTDFAPLAVDAPRTAENNRAGTTEIIELRLERDETDALLRRVPAVYRTQVNDVLLAAFASAMRSWSGRDAVWVNLEGHGRETLLDDVDLSRTVGWFTSLFPVRLDAATDEPGALLRVTKEQLRAIPRNGVGFGIARHLANDARLSRLPHPEVSFNYLGQFDQAEAEGDLFRLAEGPTGEGQHRDERRVHLLDVVASVQGGQFRAGWHYSTDLHQRATIERLAAHFIAALRRTIEHCLRLLGSGAEATGEVQDIYPLTPMQQGLLFHSLESSEADLYVEQLQGELRGVLDPHAFERAWQEVIRRHDVFRTSFVWEELDEPLQRVLRDVAFHVDVHDWRGEADQNARLDAYLAADRRSPLPLDRAPLFRVALIRMEDERWQFVWTHHHILLDGWCLNLVVREVLECYEAIVHGSAAPRRRVRPYRDYIEWLARQDAGAAQRYWTRTLAGYTGTTRLQLVERAAGAPADSGEVDLYLTAVETRRLQSGTRRRHVTLGTLVAGAWARLLQTCSGTSDAVFGVTVSGRPASLSGSDEMIGLFINTLPMRIGDGRGTPLVEWLQNVQAQQSELRDFEYSRLVDVQRWSDLPAGEPLFETLLAFDNYPVDRTIEQRFGALEIHDVRLAERTHYPLTLSVVPADELRMRALYDPQRFDAATIHQLLGSLRTLLLSAAADEVRTVDQWSLVTRDERLSLLARSGAVADDAQHECLGDWFSGVAASHPEAGALTYDGRTLTYAELDARANQLAHHLRARGVRAETLVGLCVERSADLVIAILGILKAGGAYVPLDPSYPAERLRFTIEDSGLALLVTTSGLELDTDVPRLFLDRDAEGIARERVDAPPVVLHPENAAYVIYTSGSTGRPKGCVVTHANVSRLMRQTESLYAFGDRDVWTLFHSAAFDFSVWEIWGALLYGGRLVVVPYAVSRAPE